MDDDSFLYHHRIKSQTTVLSDTLLSIFLTFFALLQASSEVIVFLDLLPYFLVRDAKMLEMSFCRKERQWS